MGKDKTMRVYKDDVKKVKRIKKKLELEEGGDKEIPQKDVVHGLLQDDEDDIVERLSSSEDKLKNMNSLF